ncbi:uncharacterized protein LOC111380418 isoform X1 [Olea europaea var. sylvestris]|uniref:uncharacterized protein LOC111380418 isoform X1 n=1 Tax=Olea europaea var. sylvestris TaxID=158386 RepID=UPI000C1D6F35|nr:uncharacterized protein LOC111380418 isoform X1 [Olea europaea var. sylvestris]XP_022859744.1 uncharacterized protein LOC111380418 isoform X1 [Olea europaea var. sylvestris]
MLFRTIIHICRTKVTQVFYVHRTTHVVDALGSGAHFTLSNVKGNSVVWWILHRWLLMYVFHSSTSFINARVLHAGLGLGTISWPIERKLRGLAAEPTSPIRMLRAIQSYGGYYVAYLHSVVVVPPFILKLPL